MRGIEACFILARIIGTDRFPDPPPFEDPLSYIATSA